MQGCFSGLLSTVAFSVLLPGLLSGLIPSVAFQCFFSRLLFSVVFQGCFHGCFQNRSNIDLTICFLPWLCFSNTTCLDHVFNTHCNPGPSEIDKHYHPLLRRRDRRDDQVGIDPDLAPRWRQQYSFCYLYLSGSSPRLLESTVFPTTAMGAASCRCRARGRAAVEPKSAVEPKFIFMTAGGKCWHAKKDCPTLVASEVVLERRACKVCCKLKLD